MEYRAASITDMNLIPINHRDIVNQGDRCLLVTENQWYVLGSDLRTWEPESVETTPELTAGDGSTDDAARVMAFIANRYALGMRTLRLGSGLWRFDTQMNLSAYTGLRLVFETGCVVRVSIAPSVYEASVHGTADSNGYLQGGGDVFIVNDVVASGSNVASNTAAGAYQITVVSGTSFAAGQRVVISDSNEMAAIRTVTNVATNTLTLDEAIRYPVTTANSASVSHVTSRPSDIQIDFNGAIVSGDCYRIFEYIGADNCQVHNLTMDDRYATAAGVCQIVGSFDDRCKGCLGTNIKYKRSVTPERTSYGVLIEGAEGCAYEDCDIPVSTSLIDSTMTFLCSVASSFRRCKGQFKAAPNVGPGWAVDCEIYDCSATNTNGLYLRTGTSNMLVRRFSNIGGSQSVTLQACKGVIFDGLTITGCSIAVVDDANCEGLVFRNVKLTNVGGSNPTQEAVKLISSDWVIDGIDVRDSARVAALGGTSGMITGFKTHGTVGRIYVSANANVEIENSSFQGTIDAAIDVATAGRCAVRRSKFKNNTLCPVITNGVVELDSVAMLSQSPSVVASATGGCCRVRGVNTWNYSGAFWHHTYGTVSVSDSNVASENITLNGATPVDYAFTDVTAADFIPEPTRVSLGGTAGPVTVTRTVGTKVTLTGTAGDTSTMAIRIGA